jgi:hypothetical protein
MNQAICTLNVAGAGSYRVLITDDELKNADGLPAMSTWDPFTNEILVHRKHSADSALGSIAHEFVHVWRFQLQHNRGTIDAYLRRAAESDPQLRALIEERGVESDGAMIVCWLKECMRLRLVDQLFRHFGGTNAADPAAAMAKITDDRQPDTDDRFRYVPDLDSQDWQRKCGRSGRRCECPRCGKTINAASVQIGEPKIDLKLGGAMAPCWFLCDHCGVVVSWRSGWPITGPFDPRYAGYEVLTGDEAEKMIESLLRPSSAGAACA